jgi:putative lipoic acid-binding regulatory protein
MSTPTPGIPEQPTLLEFPCEFPIKVVGRREDGFAQVVSGIVQRHVEDFTPSTLEMRASRNARFLSITVTFTARSREQLDALYRELSGHPLVMMVL